MSGGNLTDFDGDLWVVGLPDRELRELTSGPDADADGAVSPDGARVAFTRYDVAGIGSGGVYIVDVAGGEPTLLREDAASPAWSPDGTRIAMLDLDPFAGAFGGGIVVMDPASGEEVVVPASFAGPPAWSPDGSRIAFTDQGSFDGDPFGDPFGGPFGDPFGEMPPASIVVVDLVAGDEPQQIAQLPAAGPISWSPDGATLLLEAWDGGLTILDAATGEEETTIDVGGSYTQGARWSPDGERLAFIRVGTFGGSAVMTVPASGGEPTEIATFGSEVFVTGLIWSPDAERLAVASQGIGLTGDLYVVDADGGEPITVLTGVQYLLGWH
ncbi:MAG: TolB family protein [Candidatus Limnocylindria bacterium]